MDYEDIIMALKNGNVPSKGTVEISIGRDREIEEFRNLLMKINEGKAITKFIEGDYGTGKSFFLKVLEEIAFDENFVVSQITLSRDIPFNKFEVVYKNIVSTLKCKTGTSLEHIIERWITKLQMMAYEETNGQTKKNNIIKDNIHRDLEDARKHANSFAVAIENYYNEVTSGEFEIAMYAQAWLRGDANIPFNIKRKFGVKGDITRENAFKFLEALSAFLKRIGYSGLVILIDEAEHIMTLHTKKLRDTAYDYIRFIFDECNKRNFENTLFIFAGTPQFFDDPKLGVPSYVALDDRIQDAIDSPYPDLRKPINRLEGFKREELNDLAKKIILMHSEVFNWNGNKMISPFIRNIVDVHENNAELTGGKVTPRIFVRTFISILDTVQQNPEKLNNKEEILKLFEEREIEMEDEW
jgi:BREX system ATP-binding protein BrxC/D